jgi:hypothetical protein
MNRDSVSEKSMRYHKMIAIVLAGSMLPALAVGVLAAGNPDMLGLNEGEYRSMKNEMTEVMGNYGLMEDRDISRDDWMNMHGEMYDIMRRYEVNPRDMMWMLEEKAESENTR